MLGDIVIGICWGFGLGFLWLLYLVATAPALDEVFPIEDRPTTRGGEDRAVERETPSQSNRDSIDIHGDRND